MTWSQGMENPEQDIKTFGRLNVQDSRRITKQSGSDTKSWPASIQLSSWYNTQRSSINDLIVDCDRLENWDFEREKFGTTSYRHHQNNERLTFGARATTHIKGTVSSVLECMRTNETERYRMFLQTMYPKNYLDAEVVYAHTMSASNTIKDATISKESISLKWMALSSGKPLSRGKEFLVREYSALCEKHPQYGSVGILRFESYDGIGAKYAFRAKHDTYTLTVFEPSSYIIREAPEKGFVQVILTFAIRNAQGNDNVSSGVKLLATRIAHNLSNIESTMQGSLIEPELLTAKAGWVKDADRDICSGCYQSFGMLRRRHHCRVCGEVVCGGCTQHKIVRQSKIRICTSCVKTALTRSEREAALIKSTEAAECDTVSSKLGIPCSESYLSELEDEEIDSMVPQQILKSSEIQHLYTSYMAAKVTKSSCSSIRTTASSEQGMLDRDSFIHSGVSELKSELPGSESENHFGRRTNSSNPFAQTLNSKCSEDKPCTIRTSSGSNTSRTIDYFNEDFDQICTLAMEAFNCPVAGIRTDDFELVKYYEMDGRMSSRLPRSLPTFRRKALRGKPCVVLDASEDTRISEEKRVNAKLQFFVGVPLISNGETIGDLCVGDLHARRSVNQQLLDVLKVLAETVSRYMQSPDYQKDLQRIKRSETNASSKSATEGNLDASSIRRFANDSNSCAEAELTPSTVVYMKEVAF